VHNETVLHISFEGMWQMKQHRYTITDDSGYLALVDPVGYRRFVENNWTIDQLIQHFHSAIHERHLALWGTGRKDTWRVDVGFERSPVTGFREFSTLLGASGQHLLLTNFETLTMVVQLGEERLPEPHQPDLLIPVLSGLYLCRIVQRFDPESYNPYFRDKRTDFLVELTQIQDAESVNVDIASGIPWSNL
jgi:hypothetical protein